MIMNFCALRGTAAATESVSFSRRTLFRVVGVETAYVRGVESDG